MSRDFTTFIGVDLGGGKGKNTAVARLERTTSGARVVYVSSRSPDAKPYYDSVLIPFLQSQKDSALLAIDAPLQPSVCLRCRLEDCPTLEGCQDPTVQWFRDHGASLGQGNGRNNRKPPTTAYTQRACEVLMHRDHGILSRETLGQGMGPLTARAHYLRRALEPAFLLNRNLIEVYPKASIHVLFGKDRAQRYKREVDTWRVRAEILEALSRELQFEVWREGCLRNDHCFDAVVCAFTGYLWATCGWILPEKDRAVFEQDGWIWFPPPSE